MRKIIILIISVVFFVSLISCGGSGTGDKENMQSSDSNLIGMKRFSDLEHIGKIAPRSSDEIETSRFGIQFNMNEIQDVDLLIERTAESGVKWARVRTSHYNVSAEEGYYEWEELDKIINGLVEHKIKIFICINNRDINLQASQRKVESVETKKAVQEYADAVSALVSRYKDRVKYWEIFNEPEITPVYVNTVEEASKAINQIDSDAQVLAGSLARGQFSQLEYLINTLGSSINVVTFHPYNEFPEAIKHHWEVPVAGNKGSYMVGSMLIGELREQLGGKGQSIELWQGECGYPSSVHTRSWKGRGPWGENIQAKWLLRRFLIDYSMDIPVTVYYLLREWKGTEPPNKQNAKGLLHYEKGKPKQGFYALQHLTSIFDGALSPSNNIQTEFEILDEGGFPGVSSENDKKYLKQNPPYEGAKSPYPVEAVALTGNDEDAVIYWLPWRMQEYVKPAKANLFINGLNINNPVMVDLLNGDIYRPDKKTTEEGVTFKNLILADYPIAIVAEKMVKMKNISN